MVALDTYVAQDSEDFVLGVGVTATALCTGNDVATGGGFQSSTGLLTVNVTDSQPVFTGTGPATGWQASATATVAGTFTAFAICHDVEP
ncbi:hypothetical protein AB0M39_02760 [Streptomyces sp. NPDC051907]|uniref:hypothetical protein n=1 Tax=Streptomyces sp. NPDC051907 TaxID=3155284 RepID=UPI00341D20EF